MLRLALSLSNAALFSGGGAAIVLSASTIAEDAAAGADVGTLSVINATGTPAFSLTDTAGGRFALNVDGVTLERGATALDYEAATSHNITVAVSGVTPDPADRVFTITVTDIDDTAPTITSASTANNAENSVLAHALTANESVTWAIVGGADQARFEISGSTLRWLANGTKDFEAPDDVGANNTYVVDVRATDGASNTTDQTVTVTVTDVAEGGSLLLDLIAQAATGAYSTRKLRAAYAGACMRVRRESDNAEADIGFSSDDLDTTALLAHTGVTGADYGYVVTWYDQSGNARNFTNATALEQPWIVDAGVLNTLNSLPAMKNTDANKLVGVGISNFISASAYTAFSIFRPTAMGLDEIDPYSNHGIFGDLGGYFWQTLGTDRLMCGHYSTVEEGSNPTGLVINTNHVGVQRLASGTLVGMLDGNDAAPDSAANVDSLTGVMRVGAANGVGAFMFFSEVLFFNVALSDADINELGADMATRAGSTWTTF